MKIIVVAGARPNFVKIAPLIKELEKNKLNYILVHTGQHYDKNMSDIFFKELEIPQPQYNLGVGSGSHAEQTAKIMMEFEKVCTAETPDLIIVVGDVNSTIACALTAKKLGINVAHVEAGLRSNDNTMPEEINRILTDRISDYLFVSEESGLENLKKEGTPDEKVHHVGNVMIDTLINSLDKIEKSTVLQELNLEPKKYAIITMHRPSNVDTKEKLSEFLDFILELQEKIKIVWPIHPRVKNNMIKFDLYQKIEKNENIMLLEPQSYLNFLKLVKNCLFVLTDSGGLQEETTYLKIPCITMRENTERPSTTTMGTNTLINSIAQAKNTIEQILNRQYKTGEIPKLWDGKTAARIIVILKK
jgi:UDP-N-acetylglucosamine 2-epimerase (non-hydrolysing)